MKALVIRRCKVLAAALVISSLPYYLGCAARNCRAGTMRTATTVTSQPCASPCNTDCGKTTSQTTVVTTPTVTRTVSASNDLPPNAKPGDCYAKVFFPPKFETVTERICVKPASERIEVIPAEFEWKEKRVEIRAAEKKLEIVPAQYEWKEQTVMTDAGHTAWQRETANCANLPDGTKREVVCLVSSPPAYDTIKTQCLVSPESVRETIIPAQFETVREQVLVKAPQTRRIPIPAEERIVEKTVKVADGGMRWELVLCERSTSSEKVNAIKEALASAGFVPGPFDGQLNHEDWTAIESFQEENGLGVGALTHETLNKLGVDPDE